MSLDRWLDEGFGGEARRQYEDRLGSGKPRHRPKLTRAQEAELAAVEREAAELRERLGLNQTLTDQ